MASHETWSEDHRTSRKVYGNYMNRLCCLRGLYEGLTNYLIGHPKTKLSSHVISNYYNLSHLPREEKPTIVRGQKSRQH